MMSDHPPLPEQPVDLARGTRDWLPDEHARLARLESRLLDGFHRSGYAPMRTPILEHAELHERKSGAGIVSKLYGVVNGHQGAICLRPELTASIVRAYTAAPVPPPLPWRVSATGPVFRHEAQPREGHYREFTQVGVELIGAGGPAADAEVIWLADWSLRQVGLAQPIVRIGHVGLILEVLERSGLPPLARAALIEMLSEAAADGRDVRALESALEQLAGWLRSGIEAEEVLPAVGQADDGGVDRLFRQLVPDVIGRRSGHEIVGRLRRKWELGHSLRIVLERVRDHLQELAGLRGPAPAILDRLETWYRALAPASVASLRTLIELLGHYGVPAERIELDLGFGRGIGFYTRMIFELAAPTPEGPVPVGGGGRYDGLARVLGSDRDDRGVGFALGLERLGGVLDRQTAAAPARPGPPTIVAHGPESLPTALRLAVTLRERGLAVAMLLNEGQPNPKDAQIPTDWPEERGSARIVVGGSVSPEAISYQGPMAAEVAIGGEGSRGLTADELAALLEAQRREWIA
jgi:histidyl-tRNA synthetase